MIFVKKIRQDKKRWTHRTPNPENEVPKNGETVFSRVDPVSARIRWLTIRTHSLASYVCVLRLKMGFLHLLMLFPLFCSCRIVCESIFDSLL
jgi:hypothetical protein